MQTGRPTCLQVNAFSLVTGSSASDDIFSAYIRNESCAFSAQSLPFAMVGYAPLKGTAEAKECTSSSTLIFTAEPDTTENSSKSIGGRGRRRLHFNTSLFLSTFLVVLVTSGLAALMVFWFARHATQGGLSAAWKRGAFLLDEGTRLEGGLEAARLTGLTIASATVSFGCHVFLRNLHKYYGNLDYRNEYHHADTNIIICVSGVVPMVKL